MNRPVSRTLALTLVVTTIVVAGCDDAPTAPAALVVAHETEAALRMSESIPTLVSLVDRLEHRLPSHVDPVAELRNARSLWLDAEATSDPAMAAALRRDAYAVAVPILVAALDSAEWAAVRAALDQWIQTASSVVEGARLPGVEAALDAGRNLIARAEREERAGRREVAARLLLEAGDRLRETTPRAAARRLIHEVEQLFAAGRGEMVGAVDRRRAERLLNGAREALDADDPVRAIRRAFYARQLLIVR